MRYAELKVSRLELYEEAVCSKVFFESNAGVGR